MGISKSCVERVNMFFWGTFSILARSPENQLLGVGIATGSTFVSERVPHAKPGVGVVATQAYTNTMYGIEGLKLMERGFSPSEALDKLLKSDSGREMRQVAMMNVKGEKGVFTGIRAPKWHGEAVGENYVVIGNLLEGKEVIRKMAKEFDKSSGSLAWRIVRTLEAGRDGGGDRRGERSAALLIVNQKSFEVKINVDENDAPIEELSQKLRALRR
jgi:uncharacterized Ntn-hydrolase superfamily protein